MTMKHMTRFILVCSTALAVILSTGNVAFAQQPQDEIRRILTDEYKQAEQAGDVDAKMRLYMADAVLLPPDGDAAVGYQAVRAWHHAAYARASSQLSTAVDEVQMFGNWAFARGSWSGTITPKAGGDPKQESGKFMVLFRRQPDGGSWRIAREIWNAQDQPASANLK
jgi:uncharacterized protein (TIGR02246 family)